MSNQLNADERIARNADRFVESFEVLDSAAVGVTMVRTREPLRAVDVLKTFARGRQQQTAFWCWSIVDGWVKYDTTRRRAGRDEDDDGEPDGTKGPVDALLALEADQVGAGIYCFMYPHLLNLAQSPPMIHVIKRHAKDFAEETKRLVLLVPPAYQLPPELEDDVVIVDFDAPSYAELGESFERVISDIPDAKRPTWVTDRESIDGVLSAGAGMVMAEFETALSRALMTHREVLPDVDAQSVVEVVLAVKTEMVKKSEVLEVMPSEDIGNVGGLGNLKDYLQKAAGCFTDEARAFGIDRPKGVSLIGPPGTGKSLLAKAVAHILGLPLIRFDVSRVFNSLVGSSESRVRAALKMVDAMAPCVLLIDEVDKAFSISGGNDSGVGQRVLGAILTWMQESTAVVYTVATANRVDNLPAEFLRAGRMDAVFSVSVPGEEERLAVLNIHLEKRGRVPADVPNLQEAVERSAGYVPAEIEQAVKDALIQAFTAKEELTGTLIASQLKNMKPLSEAFAEQFAAMREWAENNARPANVGQPTGIARVRTRSRRPPGSGSRRLNLDG